jgi:hypothetical protein
MLYRSTVLALLLLLLGRSDAFHPMPNVRHAPSVFTAPSPTTSTPSIRHLVEPNTMRVAALAAKKGGQDDKIPEREKASSGLDLFLLYMTPWRNPNSIFVYFILIINILAKVREAQE